MRHQAEVFEQSFINTDYQKQQKTLCETETLIARFAVASNANTINSQ